MSRRELPPPPLIAPMPWKTGPGRAPSTTTVARNGRLGVGPMATVVSVPLAGLADRTAIPVVLEVVTSVTAITAIAARLHVLTVTRSLPRRLPGALGRSVVVDDVLSDGWRSGSRNRQSRSPRACPPWRRPRPSHKEVTENLRGK